MRLALSLAFWLFMGLSSLVAYPLAVLIWALTAPIDPRRVLLHRFTCLWGSLYTWANPAWHVELHGRERIRPDETYVMVSNHLSLLDILVISRLRTHFKWVSKVENFRIPLIGWNMSLNRYIKLARGRHASAMAMMRECEEALAQGNSIMMFPEGTRSPDGRLRPFKTGAFDLAKSTRSTILPIALSGTADALPKRGFVLRGRHEIRLSVLEAIPWTEFAELSTAELMRRVHERIAAQVASGQKTVAA
ncbi:MAG: lysophospholipid acyltransferase family protein [Myxococcota bacterium]